MFDWVKKWFPVGGPEFNSPSWLWASGRSAVPGTAPSQAELATLTGVNRACTLFSDSAVSQKWAITQSSPTGGTMAINGTDAGNAIREWDYTDREQWIFSACLLGNGYAVINRNERGGAGSIETVAPWRVSLEWTDAQNLVYRIAEDDSLQQPERVIPARDMLHLKFRQTGKHNLLGVSPLTSLAPALAPYFSIREGLAQVFNWITLPGSYFASDNSLNKEQTEQIRGVIEERESGRPVVLGSGMVMKEVPVPRLDNLQTLELSRFGIEEVARAWGVPVSMLSQTEGINYSSAAEQSRQFVTVSLQPFARRIESCLANALLTRSERLSGMAFSIDLLPLLLGHGQERSEYFSRMVNAGILTANEARNGNGLADVTGGDELRVPVNMEPLEQWITPEPEPEPEMSRSCAAITKMLEHVA